MLMLGAQKVRPKNCLMLIVAHGLVVFGARFGGDGLAHAMHKLRVPGGGHADDLREIRGVSGEGDAVQALVPPVILGHAQARDGRSVVAHLRDLFLQGHATDKIVDTLCRRNCGIHVWQRLRASLLLRAHGRHCDCENSKANENTQQRTKALNWHADASSYQCV